MVKKSHPDFVQTTQLPEVARLLRTTRGRSFHLLLERCSSHDTDLFLIVILFCKQSQAGNFHFPWKMLTF